MRERKRKRNSKSSQPRKQDYRSTLITVVDAPKGGRSRIPPLKQTDKKSARRLYWELLNEKPYHYTYPELLREVNEVLRGKTDLDLPSWRPERSALVQEFRCGLHFDAERRVA